MISINDKRYIISDAAKLIDVESHVLRYWEEELEVEVPRNEMGHRYYTEYYIELFKKIKELKEGGFQLKAIKMILPELMEINGNSAGTDTYRTLKDELFEKLISSSTEPEASTAVSGARVEKNGKTLSAPGKTATEKEVPERSVSGKFVPEKEVPAKAMMEKEIPERAISGKFVPEKEVPAETMMEKEIPERAVPGKIVSEKAVMENEKKPEISMTGTEPARSGLPSQGMSNQSKLEQFQMIIMEVVSNALKENTNHLGKEVSDMVSDNVIKEMDYLMQIREKKEEERFRKLDETIRNYQAADREKSKNRKGFFTRWRNMEKP